MAACLIIAVPLGFVKQANYRFYDFFLRLRPAPDGISPTVIVAIDDPTLRSYPSLPRDRVLVARMLDAVCAAKPAVVGLDLWYPEPGPPGADAALAAALTRCGHVVLAAAVPGKGPDAEGYEPIPQLAQAAVAVGHVHSNPDEDNVVRQ